MKVQAHADEEEAQSELDAADNAQLWSVIPWLLIGLMLPYVIYLALTRKLFNPALDGNRRLEEGLLDGSQKVDISHVKLSARMNNKGSDEQKLVDFGLASDSPFRKNTRVMAMVACLEGQSSPRSAQHMPSVSPAAHTVAPQLESIEENERPASGTLKGQSNYDDWTGP